VNKIATKKISLAETLANRANAVLAFCENITIVDDSTYKEADQKASETASLERGIKDYWDESKALTYQAWKLTCGKESEMLNPIKEGAKVLTKKMSAYRSERDRLERDKREVEQKSHEDKTRGEVFELVEDGLPQEVADKIIAQSKDSVATPVSELRGKTSFTLNYEVRLIKGKERLIPHDILLPTTPAMVKALEAKIKTFAKATGGMKIEGVEIIQTETAKRRQI
jgi:hypothetical protein